MNISDIGKRLIVGFDGTDVNDEIRFALRRLGAGGVILFSRNYEEPAQVRDLAARLRELCVHPRLLIAVDQEGGKVQRFGRPFTIWPDAASFAEHGDVEAARLFGRFNAAELAAVDIDLNFAPVCDANTCVENPVIGRRSFSADPNVVSEYAAAYLHGQQSEGVMGCAKHFPGHGGTRADSHKDLPVVEHDENRLEKVELAPFRAAATANAAFMMTAHVVYPAWEQSLPATLSKKIINLARAFPYDGLIVTDDLEMAAISERRSMEEAAVLALRAGCDMLLCCHSVARQEQIVQGVFDAVMQERLPRGDVWVSDRRISGTIAAYSGRPMPPISMIGRPEHQDLAECVRAGSNGA